MMSRRPHQLRNVGWWGALLAVAAGVAWASEWVAA